MKKKIITVASIIIAVTLIGVFALRLCVSYVFDKYLLGTTLSSLAGNVQQTEEKVDSEKIETEDIETETEETEAQETSGQTEPKKKKLTKTEIVNRVLKSSELTNKMAAMVPYEDKRAIIKIILSNFTESELNEIAKTVSKGITAEYKSKMIRTARGRLTDAQWQQCLSIAYKHIEAMRPYVE